MIELSFMQRTLVDATLAHFAKTPCDADADPQPLLVTLAPPGPPGRLTRHVLHGNIDGGLHRHPAVKAEIEQLISDDGALAAGFASSAWIVTSALDGTIPTSL